MPLRLSGLKRARRPVAVPLRRFIELIIGSMGFIGR